MFALSIFVQHWLFQTYEFGNPILDHDEDRDIIIDSDQWLQFVYPILLQSVQPFYLLS